MHLLSYNTDVSLVERKKPRENFGIQLPSEPGIRGAVASLLIQVAARLKATADFRCLSLMVGYTACCKWRYPVDKVVDLGWFGCTSTSPE